MVSNVNVRSTDILQNKKTIFSVLVNLVLMSKFAATMMMLFVVTVHNFWIRFDGRSMFIACCFCGRPINTHLFPDTRYVTKPTDSADK